MREPEGPARAARSERHDELVGAAVRAFSAKGYHSATLADIGAQAHVSQPRVSQVFGTKENAFLEALESAVALVQNALVPHAHQSYDRTRINQAYLDLFDTHQPELLIIFQAFAASSDTAIGIAARAQLDNVITMLRRTGADYPEIRDFLARGVLMKIALSADIAHHLNESDHFEPLLDSLNMTVPPEPDPGAGTQRRA